jgi:hypothetical protein
MRVKMENDWQTYRTRFLIKAKQLTYPMVFTDALGREHRGDKGDYLVETSDGARRIAPQAIFEDVYVALDHFPASKLRPTSSRRQPIVEKPQRNQASRSLIA